MRMQLSTAVNLLGVISCPRSSQVALESLHIPAGIVCTVLCYFYRPSTLPRSNPPALGADAGGGGLGGPALTSEQR